MKKTQPRIVKLKQFMLFCMLFFGMMLQAQINITGTVISSEDNVPLPGVTILIKGTPDGTATDFDGKYELTVPDANSILVFQFVGMENYEVVVGNQTIIDVSMQPSTLALSEVVVVGYGVQKKENLSGAVDQVDVDQLESRPIASVAQGLQGVSPNLNIDFNSGAPGQAARINIRGFTSINGGEPLILVDGVPSDPIELNRISPSDIENISVLKDASSAAIYGARAAFGVVLITTKLGSKEGIRVNYTNNFIFGTPTILPNKITDPYIYLRLRETSTDNTPWDNQNYSDETYAWAKERSDNPNGTDGVRINPNDASLWEYMGNRDWTDYFMSNSTYSQNHALSLNGASSNVQYFLSGSYNRNNGVLTLAEDYFDRYTLRGKVNFNVTNWFSLGTNTYLTSTDRSNPSRFSLWDLYNFHPTDWDKNPDGTWANSPVGRTGAALTQGGDSQQKYNSFQNTFNAELSILKNVLKVNADYTARRGNRNWNWFTTKFPVGFGPDDVREEGENRAYRLTQNDNYNVFNAYATLTQQFGTNHNVTAIAGYNQEYYRTEQISIDRDGVVSASLPTIALATGDANVDEYIEDWAVQGIFGRLNYTFMDKYIVEFNGRYDGSSRFPGDKRWGFFPSASVAWRVDKENFFSSLTNVVNRLKLRASYGSLGNQFVSSYGYIPTMSAVTGRYVFGDKLPQRVIPPQLVSPNYTWEDVTTTNFGIDLGFFDDRFNASFDIYQRNTIGMLTLGKDLPDVLGASEPKENAADLATKGWEVSLEYRNSFKVGSKPLGFNARFVLSDSQSEITRFDNPNNNLTQFYVGQQIGEIWGLTSDGLFQTQQEIDALDESSIIPWGALAIVPGWPKYKDLDGNGAIEKGLTTDNPKDLSVIGNTLPRYRFGFNLGLDWGGFDVSAFVQGVGKRDYYPQDYLYWGFYQQPYAGGYEHLIDFYRGQSDSEIDLGKHSQSYIDMGLASANTDATYPILQAWLADRNLGERIDQAQGLAIPQTGYLLDASYLRIKNITIGYTIPQAVTDRVNIGSLRIFFSGDNLIEWSGVKDYYDPESITDADIRANPAVSVGRQNGTGYVYPFQRRYSFGLNLDF